MPEEEKKSPAQLKLENDLMMAKAAIKHAITCFKQKKLSPPPVELVDYWNALGTTAWKEHLQLFSRELKRYKQIVVKDILFDLDMYIKDCKKLVPGFKRSREELLLMVAIGQIDPAEFQSTLTNLPSNREKLDRKILKEIKTLDWEDSRDLDKLDELTLQLDNPKIKKSEVEKIDQEIAGIEKAISERKKKREDLALKLVEWKTRGNIDIASSDGKFRLDA